MRSRPSCVHLYADIRNVTLMAYHSSFVFFFNDTSPTEISTLSLHDALPIFRAAGVPRWVRRVVGADRQLSRLHQDRKSTRLNSSHMSISYAVFCLKKKNA